VEIVVLVVAAVVVVVVVVCSSRPWGDVFLALGIFASMQRHGR